MEQELLIERIAFGSAGVGKIDRKIVFVPGTIPGELIQLHSLRDRGSYFEGESYDLKIPAASRLKTSCPYAFDLAQGRRLQESCRGCTYQHLSYEIELAAKHQQLQDIIKRIAKVPLEHLSEPIAASEQEHYRNKITLHAHFRENKWLLGYIAEDNTTFIPIQQCLLAVRPIQEALASGEWKDHCVNENDEDRITFRYTETDGVKIWSENQLKREIAYLDLHETVHGKPKEAKEKSGEKKKPAPAPVTLRYLHPYNKKEHAIASPAWLTETTPRGSLKVPLNGFFQIHPSSTEKLVQRVLHLCHNLEFKQIIDLFCGCGLFSLALGQTHRDATILGIDSDREVITAARHNAFTQGYRNEQAIFKICNVWQDQHSLRKYDLTQALIILDPPRAGLTPSLINFLIKNKARQLIYVSCAPDTWARDIALFAKGGFRLVNAGIVDLFPRTHHFETVSLLCRP